MKIKAYAKVNLNLKVFLKTNKDTKHKIKSLITIYKHIYDEIFIQPSNKTSVTYLVNNKKITIANDVVSKSIKWLQHQYRLKQNYEVKVIKHIPIAAGLGGSSTDGAAVIKCICKHQKININRLNLKNIALDLSSDMPFFIKNFNTAIISNYGEKVVKYTKSLPKFKVILTNVAFNTKNVYSQWDQLKTKSKSISKKTFYNDLQPIVLRNKTLNSLFNKLLKQNKKVMVCGSGGSIIQFNYE